VHEDGDPRPCGVTGDGHLARRVGGRRHPAGRPHRRDLLTYRFAVSPLQEGGSPCPHSVPCSPPIPTCREPRSIICSGWWANGNCLPTCRSPICCCGSTPNLPASSA